MISICVLDGLATVSKHSIGRPYIPCSIVMLHLTRVLVSPSYLTEFGFQAVIAFAELGSFDFHHLLTLWNLTNLIGLGTGAHYTLA